MNHITHGSALEETASFLCRAGTSEDVARKAKELGFRGRPAELPSAQAEVIDLVYYHDKSIGEVARITGITEATVKAAGAPTLR